MDSLTAALVEAIVPHLPDGIRMVPTEGGAHVRADGQRGEMIFSAEPALAYAEGDPGRLAHALAVLLSELQDYVAEATAEPWPGHAVLPQVGTKIDDGLASIEFIEGGQPVLTLQVHIGDAGSGATRSLEGGR
jgi:hypothetical protein